MPEVLWLVIGAVVGIALGFVITRFVVNASTKRAAQEAESLVADAKKQAETLRREAIVEAKDEVLKMKQDAQAENKERLREVRAAENRLSQREESLDRRVESLDSREHQISSMQGQLERRERDLKDAAEEINHRLERVAGIHLARFGARDGLTIAWRRSDGSAGSTQGPLTPDEVEAHARERAKRKAAGQ